MHGIYIYRNGHFAAHVKHYYLYICSHEGFVNWSWFIWENRASGSVKWSPAESALNLHFHWPAGGDTSGCEKKSNWLEIYKTAGRFHFHDIDLKGGDKAGCALGPGLRCDDKSPPHDPDNQDRRMTNAYQHRFTPNFPLLSKCGHFWLNKQHNMIHI